MISPLFAIRRPLAFAASVFAIAALARTTEAANGNWRLLLLHNNDMHCRFAETDKYGRPCRDSAPCYGGFGRMKTAMDQARREAQMANVPTLSLNAGDTAQGTAFFTFLGMKIVADMLGRLDIDVMSLGNHEFDLGVERLHEFLDNVTIPVVACNLDFSEEPILGKEKSLSKSKVVTVNGHQIGIIGYVLPDTKFTSNVGNVKFLPEIPSVSAEARRLKSQGVDIIIGLGHSGFRTDIEMAKRVPELDLIVGGHSNTFLYNGEPPDADKPSGPYPYWVEQPGTGRRVPVVQALYVTKYLGKLWMEFDRHGEVVSCDGNPVLLDSSVAQDPEILETVNVVQDEIVNKTNEVVAYSAVFLEGDDYMCRVRECNLGNIATDAFVDFNLRKYITSFNVTEQWTDAAISVIPSGALRTSINAANNEGKITRGDVLMVFPYMNDVGKITVEGSVVWQALEHSVSRHDSGKYHGDFLQVSGLKVVADVGKPVGRRVQSIDARCAKCVVPVYEPLVLDQLYTIVVSDFLANGGNGYTMFKTASKYISIGKSDEPIIEHMMRIKSPIRQGLEGRITVINSGPFKSAASCVTVSPIMTAVMIALTALNGY
ncbi:protein 5NUC-like [Adelges cooleyi]|uniref:protein 5NUC-like n=1 Tax=Adelges cooleyi TaxID=133065 RepID=UPI00217FBD4F|nr:protein 5NUC-like [Adelges cooleyi]